MIEPAGFATGGQNKVVWGTPHAAYSNTQLPATQMRNAFFSVYEPDGDARKGAEAFYKIALVDDPPLHFPIGEMAVLWTKKKAELLLAETAKYESWSGDMKVQR